LDEPTSGLDVYTRKTLLDYLQVVKSRGGAVVLSSHYMREVEDTCDCVVLLHRGKCVAHGSVAELVSRFGGGHVEIVTRGGRTMEHGTDVIGILEKYRGAAVLSVNVIAPSLDALFTTLTANSAQHLRSQHDQ